tara:strand:+ start:256 stop:405 length:150 start_codon:yes stop_codon:yes gene_type:complete
LIPLPLSSSSSLFSNLETNSKYKKGGKGLKTIEADEKLINFLVMFEFDP